MALHAQTWQLAEHGGIRVGRSGFAMPGPAYLGQKNTEQGSCCLAKQPKYQTKADWRFTTAEARIKLKRLYPRFE
jgi:hypothetical protein